MFNWMLEIFWNSYPWEHLLTVTHYETIEKSFFTDHLLMVAISTHNNDEYVYP